MLARPNPLALRLVSIALLLCSSGGLSRNLLAQDPLYGPPIAAASEEAEQAIQAFQPAEGHRVELYAAEPNVVHPVSFCFDQWGRCFVAETFRQEEYGVPDNRGHMYWLEDDLAAQTVEDRGRMYLKHHPEYAELWVGNHDRIRRLEDLDDDGRVDHATVYADGFNDLLDGTGAGVLADGKNLYFTCIPKLWLLRDEDDDGVADERQALHHGYGVRVALRGHDLHGLTFGPDGRLYFSVGDRGFNVETMEGTRLVDPGRGAVFRCQPDGSELEVFYFGLRNPQELAFDQFGNLFTCDNNSDAGDRARLVYLMEGADSGWHMSYQYRGDRGPWMPEKWWQPRHEGQAAFLNPPLANITSGPSGLAYYPGTGLSDRYLDSFFLCDFRGGSANSGVINFRVEADGAGYRFATQDRFVWGVLATDLAFGPGGGLYVSDWVHGWVGVGKGRIYRVLDPELEANTSWEDRDALIARDFSSASLSELAGWLAHADQRIRQRAQFALAARGPESAATLIQISRRHDDLLARLHAVWGLGQLARQHAWVGDRLLPLLDDPQAEVRSQTAKVLGEAATHAALEPLLRRLRDPELRVRYFAAMALGRLGDRRALEPILAVLEQNQDQDLFLRHGCVMGLSRLGHHRALLEQRDHPSASVRLGVLLALRKLKHPAATHFLSDPVKALQTEAARAIYDVPIRIGFEALAAVLDREELGEEALVRRAVAANDMLGGTAGAERLARLSQREDAPVGQRREAIEILRDWDTPPNLERVLNRYWPREARTREQAEAAVRAALPTLLVGAPDGIRARAAQTAARYGVQDVEAQLFDLLESHATPIARTEALIALHVLESERLQVAVQTALAADHGRIRGEAAKILAELDPEVALPVLQLAVHKGSVAEQQLGLRTLAAMKHPEADRILSQRMDSLLAGEVGPEAMLELLEATRQRAEEEVGELAERVRRYEASLSAEDPLATWRACLSGGDAERGRKIFFEKSEVECRRCHAIGDQQVKEGESDAGPDLTGIGSRQDREYLLESIVNPNLNIVFGYQKIILEVEDGPDVMGRLVGETEEALEVDVVNKRGVYERILVPKQEITGRYDGISAMPTNLTDFLSKEELRDLVEFLSTQTEPASTSAED